VDRYLNTFKKVNIFEQNNNLSSFDSEYGNVWPLFRFFIINHYTHNRVSLPLNNLFIREFGRLKKILEEYSKYSNPIKPIDLNLNEVEEIWYSNSKLRLENKDNYNKYLDPFFFKLSCGNAVVFERDSSKPARYRYTNLFGNKFVYNIYPEYLRFSVFNLVTKRRLSFRKFKNKFDLDQLLALFPELTKFDFYVQFRSFLDDYNFYDYFFLKCKNLKKIHFNAYYCTENIAIQSVANKYNIEVVDIQHGVQAVDHYAYGNWKQVDNLDLLPNSFYVFSEQEKLLLNNSFRGQKKIKVVGNLMYEKWRSEKGESQELANVILFSLQNIVYPVDHFIFSFFKELNKEYVVLLRLHPRHLYIKKEIESCFVKNNIFFEWDVNEDVFDSLEKVVLHITGFSSVVKDALFFGVPSILIDKRGRSYYEEEIEKSNLVMYAENLKTLMINFGFLINNK